MKDKLRELAERWAERIGGEPSTTITSKEVCELLAVLDAEGDGGAVDFSNDVIIDRGALQMALNVLRRNLKNEVADELVAACKPLSRPARSGVVSEEDVDGALKFFYNDGYLSEPYYADPLRSKMRAALEHFARGERHER